MKPYMMIVLLLAFASCEKDEETAERLRNYILLDPVKKDLAPNPDHLTITRNLAKTWTLDYYITHHIRPADLATFNEGGKYTSGIYDEVKYTLKLNPDSTYVKTLRLKSTSTVTTHGTWAVKNLHFTLQDSDLSIPPEEFILQYTQGESATLKLDRAMNLPTEDLSMPGTVYLNWPQIVLHVFSEHP